MTDYILGATENILLKSPTKTIFFIFVYGPLDVDHTVQSRLYVSGDGDNFDPNLTSFNLRCVGRYVV